MDERSQRCDVQVQYLLTHVNFQHLCLREYVAKYLVLISKPEKRQNTETLDFQTVFPHSFHL